MSIECKEIIRHMNNLAPEDLAFDWDNVGLLIGDNTKVINTVLIALDITDEVINEAIRLGAELIISHHPLIFKPINKINNDSPVGKRILKLIKYGICVYCSHTNLDISNYGTNDTLFNVLNLHYKEHLMDCEKEGYSLGRVGTLEKSIKLKELSKYVKQALNLTSIRFTGNENTYISKVGLCTGASSSYKMFSKAKEKGCQVFITGDIKYHEAQVALDMGLCLIDATHYASEVIVIENLKDYLVDNIKCNNINIITSKVNGQTFHNI